MLSQMVALIEAKHRLAITSHARPDGDGLGSSLALLHVLESLGKEATVVLKDQVPHAYRELPGVNRIQQISMLDEIYDAVFVTSLVNRPCESWI